MCAIVDANVASEIFGPSPQPAGEKFLEWISKGTERLVTGGRLLKELEASSEDFRRWAILAVPAGQMRIVNEREVDTRAEEVRSQGVCKSNDPHIIALAQVSGSRLLYSNDGELQQDFKNKRLIDNPRGKVYSTLEDKGFKRRHQRLLANRDLCRVGP